MPRMTITSYPLDSYQPEKEIVWYLGGDIAEKGVSRSRSQQIEAAKRELQLLIPWLDFSPARWSTLRIDRAEPHMTDGSRPAEPLVSLSGKVITAWPVKLAMTPLMTDAILNKVKALGIQANLKPVSVQIPQAQTSQFPWEKVQHWYE